MRLRARACLVAIGVLTLVMTVGGTVRAQQAPRAPQPAAGAAQAIESGKATWAKLACSTCHGPDAAGTAAAPKLAMTMLALPAFTGYVRKPTGTMPPQGEQMVSDRELGDIFAYLHSPAIQQAQSAPAPAPGSVAAGAALYKKNGCYECHVDNAQGGPQGPRLGPNPIPMPRFMAYVRNPSGDMPPFTSKVLSDQELASIYAFLQAQPVPPPPASIPLLAP
jgi:ubiquinol-cytochrome c reductase cytochrome c subunit